MAILLEISIYKIYATDQAALYKKKSISMLQFFFSGKTPLRIT